MLLCQGMPTNTALQTIMAQHTFWVACAEAAAPATGGDSGIAVGLIP